MGNVRFDGLGIANRAEPVRQRDALSYLDFSGLLSEIRLLDLSESESGGGGRWTGPGICSPQRGESLLRRPSGVGRLIEVGAVW